LPYFEGYIKSKYYTSTAVLLFVFTVYKTVGHTLNIAFEGIFGTLIAVLNIWILQGYFPNGVTETSSDEVWWAGVTDCVAYVLLVIAMDLDKTCKMFALNWHCYFWMDFMGMVSVLLDISFIANADSFLSGDSSSGGGSSDGVVMRAARMAKLGARAHRRRDQDTGEQERRQKLGWHL